MDPPVFVTENSTSTKLLERSVQNAPADAVNSIDVAFVSVWLRPMTSQWLLLISSWVEGKLVRPRTSLFELGADFSCIYSMTFVQSVTPTLHALNHQSL